MNTRWIRNKRHDVFLWSLIGKRFNKESLLVELNNHFNEIVAISTMTDEEADEEDTTDWRYYIETSEQDYCIFYLKMRSTGWDGSNIYITEVI